MVGAREFSTYFKTGQYGKLYIVSGVHARGRTFHIYVLPEGEKILNPGGGKPYNPNAVEVYGIISGLPGWTEQYGWLYRGKWVDDFNTLFTDRRELFLTKEKEQEQEKQKNITEKQQRDLSILAEY